MRDPTTIRAIDSSNYDEKDAHDDVFSTTGYVYLKLQLHIDYSFVSDLKEFSTPPRTCR